MKYGSEKLGWKRRNPCTNKGIYPPWVWDNEYRADFIYNNPGYHPPHSHLVLRAAKFWHLYPVNTRLLLLGELWAARVNKMSQFYNFFCPQFLLGWETVWKWCDQLIRVVSVSVSRSASSFTISDVTVLSAMSAVSSTSRLSVILSSHSHTPSINSNMTNMFCCFQINCNSSINQVSSNQWMKHNIVNGHINTIPQ